MSPGIKATLRRLLERKATGIVWAGPIFAASGYGSVSRNYLLGLSAAGYPVQAINIGAQDIGLLDPSLVSELRKISESYVGPSPVLVVHFEPVAYRKVFIRNSIARIGCTIFETDRIPNDWVNLCNEMDEIWVPSKFNLETFSRSGVRSDKLHVVPYCVDTKFFRPISEKLSIYGIRGFKFLYVSFWDWRKGFDLLLEAYFNEFTSRDDVTLIIRTSFPSGHSGGHNDVRQLLTENLSDRVDLSRPDLPNLVLLTSPLDQHDLRKLYNTCDLYISTDRANGWGMPCMEAMAMGKPASQINWSGGTEFMREDNSLLIHTTGRLVPIDTRLAKARPIYAGHQWAEVDVAEVRRVMRFAYENQRELTTLSRRGCHDVRENYNFAIIASKIKGRTSSIRGTPLRLMYSFISYCFYVLRKLLFPKRSRVGLIFQFIRSKASIRKISQSFFKA